MVAGDTVTDCVTDSTCTECKRGMGEDGGSCTGKHYTTHCQSRIPTIALVMTIAFALKCILLQ